VTLNRNADRIFIDAFPGFLVVKMRNFIEFSPVGIG